MMFEASTLMISVDISNQVLGLNAWFPSYVHGSSFCLQISYFPALLEAGLVLGVYYTIKVNS